jgi:hypothetical protein
MELFSPTLTSVCASYDVDPHRIIRAKIYTTVYYILIIICRLFVYLFFVVCPYNMCISVYGYTGLSELRVPVVH